MRLFYIDAPYDHHDVIQLFLECCMRTYSEALSLISITVRSVLRWYLRYDS